MKKPLTILLIVVLVSVLTGCSSPIEEITVGNPSAIKNAPAVNAQKGDWPWWRGPTLDGKATGPSPPTSWSEKENVVWSAKVPGRGHATPSVFGNQVFVATADDNAQTMSLLCYERSSGEPLWSTELHSGGFMHTHGKNSHASSTPACDGERVTAVFMVNDGIWVSSVSLDGEILWQKEAGSFKPRHGYGSSPLIHKSLVIVAGDNDRSGFLAALDRESGEIAWRIARANRSSFGTPVVADVAGQTQLLLSGQNEVASYDPETGKEIWTSEGPASTTANTMVWSGDLVFASGGYPQRNVMAIRADGSGEVVWQKKYKGYVPSLLVDDGRLLVVQDDGVARCFAAETGEELWKQRLGGSGFSASPVLVGDHIFVPNEAGTMFVFEWGDTFKSVSENQLASGGFASPVVCGGQLFIRTADKLFCIAPNQENEE